MGKYKYAVEQELEWLDEDYEIAYEMIDRIDKGENVGYPREYMFARADFASRARERLKMFLDEYKKL